MNDTSVLWEETVQGGATWSHVLKRGTALRITDSEGGANAGALFYNFECPVERYNMPDTLKAQHAARLTAGLVLYSDMGRVLCSVTEDTVGWHDPIGGCSNAAMVRAKYGEGRYQDCRNAWHKNALDSFLVELAKWGLGKRDVMANVNFFSKVTAEEDGRLVFHSNHGAADDFVDLRFEMNALVVLSTSVHPLDTRPTYEPQAVKLTAWRSGVAPAQDLCRNLCPENVRGFANTERYFAT